MVTCAPVPSPTVVTTDRIQTRLIDPDALKVIRRLRRYGHEAYLVGGCVRDLLCGLVPKDFDVITSARPRQVRRLFSNSRVIGRRFRLVHVIFNENIIEVSTFRADPSQFATESEERAALAATPEGGTPAAAEGTPPATDSGEGLASGEGAPPEADEPEVDELDEPGADDVDEVDDASRTDEPIDDVDDEVEGEDVVPLDQLDAAIEEVHDATDPDDRGSLGRARDAAATRDPPLGRDDDDDVLDEDLRDDDDQAPRGRRGRGNRDDRARDRDADELNNMFGDPEQDARRRDFTINALFFDPDERKLIDYTGGLPDLERKVVASIRDPEVAFVEDPVRMIRAARFAAKLGFAIDPPALAAIERHRGLLDETSQRRLLEEILKILKGGYASPSVRVLIETGMIEQFLPDIGQWIGDGPPDLPKPIGPTPPAATPAATPAEPANSEGTVTRSSTSGRLPPPPQGAAEDPPTEPLTRPDMPPPEPEAPAPAPPEPEPSLEAEVAEAAASASRATRRDAKAPQPYEAPAAPAPEPEREKAAPVVPSEAWGPRRELQPSGIAIYPRDGWRPDVRTIDAYLRVTWQRPPLEGANDWLEDPHVYVQDAIFEAAAFARDTVLDTVGRADRVDLPSERDRAAALLRVLRWNGRLEQVVASFTDEDRARSERVGGGNREGGGGGRGRGRRRRGGGRHQDRDEPRDNARDQDEGTGDDAGGPTSITPIDSVDRAGLLLGYLEGLDRLSGQGVPLSPAVQLSILFAPMLLTRLQELVTARRGAPIEELCDGLLMPIARRHSLARRDRDRMKRILLALRRLLSGELRRKARAGGRLSKLVARDSFREAIVLLWLHCRTTAAGWEEFRYWEQRAKARA